MDDRNIVKAPGSATTYLAASSTQEAPHKVVVHSASKIVCDCLVCRSAKICAHSLAVAEKCSAIFNFLAWYKHPQPSVERLANIVKPNMHGRQEGQCTSAKK